MPFSHFEPPHLTKRVIVKKTARYWKRTCAWILAPVLIGLVGVGMAQASDYAFEINTWIVKRIPWASILYMPAGFALIAYIARRFFSGYARQRHSADHCRHRRPGSQEKKQPALHQNTGRQNRHVAGRTDDRRIHRARRPHRTGRRFHHAPHFMATEHSATAEQRRMLALSGGAAGIAAAFNTPLAGIMFAMEELTKNIFSTLTVPLC